MWRSSRIARQGLPKPPYRVAGALSLMEPATQGAGGAQGGADDGIDHLAVDASGFIGGALRLLKTEGPRKDHETARIVMQNLASLARRFQPGKSLAVFLDGTEPLWATAKARTTGARKAELRSARLPGGPLVSEVEEAVLEALPDRRLSPPEVVFSGSLSPGLVEHKMAAWLHTVAARNPRDSVALVGANDLYLSAVASPVHRTSVLVQNNAEYKTVGREQLIKWLALPDPSVSLKDAEAQDTHQRRVADATFLLVLGGGVHAASIPAVANAALPDLLDAYHQTCCPAEGPPRFLLRRSDVLLPAVPCPTGLTRNPAAAIPCYNAIDTAVLSELLSKLPVKGVGAPQYDPVCADYLLLALEGQRMLSYGHIANPHLVPRAGPEVGGQPAPYPASPKVTSLIAHAKAAQHRQAVVEPLPGGDFTTAAEHTVLNTTSGPVAKKAVATYVGHGISSPVAAQIASNTSTLGALSDVRSVLRFANPRNPHRSLCHAPSLCLMEQQSHGKSSWRMFPVDLFPEPRPEPKADPTAPADASASPAPGHHV